MAAIWRDNRLVESSEQPPKSIGAEETFENNIADSQQIEEALVELLMLKSGLIRQQKHSRK